MKLTAEMFDFEKYDYSYGTVAAGVEYLNTVSCGWMNTYPNVENERMRIMRTLKPPPRYILLNEGEKLQDGDEEAHREPLSGRLMWEAFWVGSGIVKVNQIWRRKAP